MFVRSPHLLELGSDAVVSCLTNLIGRRKSASQSTCSRRLKCSVDVCDRSPFESRAQALFWTVAIQVEPSTTSAAPKEQGAEKTRSTSPPNSEPNASRKNASPSIERAPWGARANSIALATIRERSQLSYLLGVLRPARSDSPTHGRVAETTVRAR